MKQTKEIKSVNDFPREVLAELLSDEDKTAIINSLKRSRTIKGFTAEESRAVIQKTLGVLTMAMCIQGVAEGLIEVDLVNGELLFTTTEKLDWNTGGRRGGV